VAFLIGAIALPFGVLLRRTLPETLHRHEARTAAQADDTSLRAGTPVLLQGLGLIGASTISTYVFAYLTTYAFKTLHMPAGVSLGATAVSGTCGLAAGLIGGALSDRFGRRPLMIWPRLFFLLATWPVFWVIVHFHNGPALLIGTAILTFSSALSTAAVFVAIAESLRKEVRVMGMGMVYAVAVAVFGGTTQPIIASLVEFTHDPLSVAWYTVAATGVGLIASLTMRETAHRRIAVA
jgi:MFS family permease